jgi:nucleoside-diphosphate-sugar epimerase
MTMKKILITGGAGFVGRHFVKYFLDQGDKVICVDSIVPLTGGIDPNDGWPLFSPFEYENFEFLKMDCRDFFVARDDTDFDLVIHLAAMVGGREMIENNPLAVAEDLAIDAMYWSWAARVRPKKSICFSSSAAYPIDFQRSVGYCLLKEDMISFNSNIGMPDMSYGWAKLTHEYLAQLAYEKYGINSVTYRPFSGYGEDQDSAYPFPSICKRVLSNFGNSKLQVWGTGDQMRDFIHISDCVAGVIATMDQVNDGSAINLSTGILTSFKEFALSAAKIAGYETEVYGNSTKPEGVFARGGDTALQKSLGFTAKVSFNDGISRALKYFSNLS